MKVLKLGLRVWITVTSLVSFLAGWILLAHAPKPVSAKSASSGVSAPLPTLEPLRSLQQFQSDDDNSQNPSFFNVQPRNRSRPFFSTGGS